jgi:hypothetical protein
MTKWIEDITPGMDELENSDIGRNGGIPFGLIAFIVLLGLLLFAVTLKAKQSSTGTPLPKTSGASSANTIPFAVYDNVTDYSDKFKVDHLTPDEIKRKDAADKVFADAQAKHDAAINKIKNAHGQTIYQWGLNGWIVCGWTTDVELRGEYALITSRYSSCTSW